MALAVQNQTTVNPRLPLHQQSAWSPIGQKRPRRYDFHESPESRQVDRNESGVPDVLNSEFMTTLHHVLGRLEEIVSLPDNWDSYGASRITSEAQRSAVLLLAELISHDIDVFIASTEVYPVPTGGMQFEWTVMGRDVEFEIDPTGAAHVLLCSDEDEIYIESAREAPMSIEDALEFIHKSLAQDVSN